MTAQVVIAIATLAAGVVGLVLYLLKRQDSPETVYRRAADAYDKAVKEETEAINALKTELDKSAPDTGAVRRLGDAVRDARNRVSAAKAERDRLRPRG